MSHEGRPRLGARGPLRGQQSLDLYVSKPRRIQSVREVPDPRGEPGAYETLCHDCDRVVIRVPEGVASDFDVVTGRTTPIEYLEVVEGRIMPHHCGRPTLDDHQIADLMPPICGGSGDDAIIERLSEIPLAAFGVEDAEGHVKAEAQGVLDEIRAKLAANVEVSDHDCRRFARRILSAVDVLAEHDVAHGSPVISPPPRLAPDERPLSLGAAVPVAPQTLPGGAETDVEDDEDFEDEDLDDDDFETDDGDDDYDDEETNGLLRAAFRESAVAAGFEPLRVRHEGRLYCPESADLCPRCGKVVLLGLEIVDRKLGAQYDLRGPWVVSSDGRSLVPHPCEKGGAR